MQIGISDTRTSGPFYCVFGGIILWSTNDELLFKKYYYNIIIIIIIIYY